jgi:hypothetical protein
MLINFNNKSLKYIWRYVILLLIFVPTKTNYMNTFNYYKHLKKSAVRILVNSGVNIRVAFNMVRNQMPYLFMSKSDCDFYDTVN